MKQEYSKRQIREAMRWVLLHEEGLSEEQERAFVRWKKQHPNHEKCFFEHQVDWSNLDSMRFWKPELSSEPNPDLFVSRRALSTWTWLWGPAVGIAACVLLMFTWHSLRPVEPEVLTTTHSNWQQFEAGKKHFLSDGSTVYLKQGSDLRVWYDAKSRRLDLRHGEAIFEVAHDAERAFVVGMQHAEVVALGTVFSVNASDTFCEVYVTEGRVALKDRASVHDDPTASEPWLPELKAGEMVNFRVGENRSAPEVHRFSTAEYQSKMIWKDQIIEMVSAPLYQIIEEFNRFNAVDIVISDPALGQLRMSVTVSPDNQQEFLELLEMTLQIEVVESATGIVLQPKS